MRGLLSLDALMALIVVSLLAAWLAGTIPNGVSESADFGSYVQAKGGAVSVGMQANAFHAAGISDIAVAVPRGAIMSKEASFSVTKGSQTVVSVGFNEMGDSYPVPFGFCISGNVLKSGC
ncbi:hypothetical protein HYS54_05040 [Candidatus Micrarchaeota archaeon]|nr:hypothetical protein [Candidatus Micrarchaeota archaeon]